MYQPTYALKLRERAGATCPQHPGPVRRLDQHSSRPRSPRRREPQLSYLQGSHTYLHLADAREGKRVTLRRLLIDGGALLALAVVIGSAVLVGIQWRASRHR